MSITFGYKGVTYDDVKPLYIDLGHNRVVNRLTHQVLDKAALLAQMAAENYTPGAHEIGDGGAWLTANTGPWSNWEEEGIPAASVTPAITGIPAAVGASATVQIQTGGKGLDAAAVATVTIKHGTAADVVFTVNIPKGEQGHGILAEIAKAAQWAANDLAVSVAGAQMTVTNNHATDALTKLTVSLA